MIVYIVSWPAGSTAGDLALVHCGGSYANNGPQTAGWTPRGHKSYGNDFRWGTSDITPEEVRAELAGKDLACWCPLSSPCHADVLLELANAGEPS